MDKLVSGVNLTGGKAFATADAANNTKTNGTDYAGYTASSTYTGSSLVIMTNQYGRDQKLDITCSNEQLAGLLD